jgi:hypothetical protein
MKKIMWILSLIVGTGLSASAQNQDPYNDNTSDETYYNDNSNYNEEQADNSGMSYQTFYDQLSPYGNWVNYPGYGYVWVPQVDEGFSPYMTSGHWEYTDMGWTWVSDYQWGWATFHYGRWFEDPDYGGWLWIPGYDWAPAWVNWGNYEGYYCWTPIGPRDYVNGQWGYGGYDHHWFCLPHERMGEANIGRYIVGNQVVNHDSHDFASRVTIIHNTNVYSRSVFNAGPKVEDVEHVVNHPITRAVISNSNNPGRTQVHGNTINIYRPNVSRNATEQHAVPSKVINPSEIEHNNAPANNRAEQPHSSPARTNDQQPSRSSWTPPRQSTPQPRQSEPAQRSGGFIPSERPAMQEQRSAPMEQRSAPAPSFHAPSGGGGHVGGGRH